MISTVIKRTVYHRKNGKHICNICGCQINSFVPGGVISEASKKHFIVGAGYRDNYRCPCCNAIDRMRWQKYVVDNYLEYINFKGTIIHFAPEKMLSDYYRNKSEKGYFSADISKEKADFVVDITDIFFKDKYFDVVIANHVLEHILDEKKAVSEILRVLKDDGVWMFSVPYATDVNTFESDLELSPEERLREFGQKDHVRLYGKDYINRFKSYGLAINVYEPENLCSTSIIEKYGFLPKDMILVASKSV